MHTTRTRLVAALTVALAAAGIVAVQSPANAAVTTSTITSPKTGTHFMIKDSAPAGTVTVKGTTNGTSGSVDVRCYETGSSTFDSVTENVPVQANGTFSALMSTSNPYGRCRLLAVPHDYPDGASLTAFHGPVVTTEYVTTDQIASGPNSGKTYNYYVAFQSDRAFNDFASATGPGLWDSRLTSADGSSSNYFWYGNASMRDTDTEEGRYRLKVDGRNAFGPRSAQSLFQNNAGLPALTFSAVRSTKTGLVTIKERNPIVLCPTTATTFPPTAANCPTFVSAGVTLDRTIVVNDSGLQVHVSDTWRSTDGKKHLVSPFYYQTVEGYDAVAGGSTPVALKYSWTGKFATFSAPTVTPGPKGLPASIYLRTSYGAADGNSLLPRGAITFDFPLTVARNSRATFTLRASTFTVPAGGSKVTRQGFVIGTTDAAVAAKAAAQRASFS